MRLARFLKAASGQRWGPGVGVAALLLLGTMAGFASSSPVGSASEASQAVKASTVNLALDLKSKGAYSDFMDACKDLQITTELAVFDGSGVQVASRTLNSSTTTAIDVQPVGPNGVGKETCLEKARFGNLPASPRYHVRATSEGNVYDAYIQADAASAPVTFWLDGTTISHQG